MSSRSSASGGTASSTSPSSGRSRSYHGAGASRRTRGSPPTARACPPLTDTEARRVAADTAALGVEAVAIALLFSFVGPEHERRLRGALERAAPGPPAPLAPPRRP